jgi:hypothetical protein
VHFQKPDLHESAKKLREKQGPIFPHLEILATIQKMKNVKSKSFLSKKRYGNPLLRRSFSKTRFARKRKKVREKPSAIFPHLEIFCMEIDSPTIAQHSFLDLDSQPPDLYSAISFVLSRNMGAHKELWAILGQL